MGPGSPALPVFTRRKRSVFKGPMGGSGSGSSPSGFGRTPMKREGSLKGRRSGDMITGITEEEEEEGGEEDDAEMEDMLLDEGDEEEENFGPALGGALLPGREREREEGKDAHDPALSPSPSPNREEAALGASGEHARKEVRLSVPLTAEALAKMEAEEEAKAFRGSS